MIWQEVKLYTSSVGAEMLAAELLRLGVAGWQQESARELRNYLQAGDSPFDYADETLREQAAAMDEDAVILTIYLAEDEGREQTQQIMAGLEQLAAQTDAPWGELRIIGRRRDSEEWEDNWKQYYKPFKVGKRLVVCPSWEEYRPAAEERLLLIEPGGSFGTGQHQTTKLCLELMEQYIQPGSTLLDLGCGTGILSIGGVLLGAAGAVAVDIEQHSAKAAAENAARNGLTEAQYQTFWGDILADQELLTQLKGCAASADHDIIGYDMIVVNIVADVIIAMSPLFRGLLAEAGRIICSGVIDNRRDEVVAAMEEQGFRLLEDKQDKGWYAMAFAVK